MNLQHIPEALPHLRDAVYHMLCMWDAMRAAETELDGEVEESDLSGLAYALYSEDDGVVLFGTRTAALSSLRHWRRQGANGCEGPFGPYMIDLKIPVHRRKKKGPTQ